MSSSSSVSSSQSSIAVPIEEKPEEKKDYFQELAYFSNFLWTNPLSAFWKKNALTHMPRKIYPILIPVYIAGMAGYAIVLPLRVMGVAKDILYLVADTCYGLKKKDASDRFLIRTIVLLASVGDVCVAAIGILFPPLAYFLDEKIQLAYFEIYDNSYTTWSGDTWSGDKKSSTLVRKEYSSEIKKMVEARIALRPFVDKEDRSAEAYFLFFQASIHLWLESDCAKTLIDSIEDVQKELKSLQEGADAQRTLLRDLIFRKLASSQNLEKPRSRNDRQRTTWEKLDTDLDTFEKAMSKEKREILESYCNNLILLANKLVSKPELISQTKVLYETAMKKIVLFV